jgi:hypothetical protein
VIARTRSVWRRSRPKAADEVEEPDAEPLQRLPLLLLHGLGGLADQDHEQRDQREHDDHRDAAGQVLPEHHDHQDRRRDPGEQQLGQVAGKVIVERVQTLRREGRHPCALLAGEPVRAALGNSAQQKSAQLALHGCRAAAGRDLEQPDQRGAEDHDSGESPDVRGKFRRAAAGHRECDHLAEQPGEADHDERLGEAEHRPDDQEPPRGRGVTEESGVEGTHVLVLVVERATARALRLRCYCG